MKIFPQSLIPIASVILAALLTGCAAPDLKATFAGRGDEVLYGRVARIVHGEDMLAAHDVLCGTKYPGIKKETYSDNIDQWLQETGFCKQSHLDAIQQVMVAVGVVNFNGDTFVSQTFSPKDVETKEGDIATFKVYPGPDGRHRRPAEFIKVAAKAKDATKENGCYWDAGVGMWAGGFTGQGGAICEGWDWKKHPFSNPALLKK